MGSTRRLLILKVLFAIPAAMLLLLTGLFLVAAPTILWREGEFDPYAAMGLGALLLVSALFVMAFVGIQRRSPSAWSTARAVACITMIFIPIGTLWGILMLMQLGACKHDLPATPGSTPPAV